MEKVLTAKELKPLVRKHLEDKKITGVDVLHRRVDNPFPIGSRNAYELYRGVDVSLNLRAKMTAFFQGLDHTTE